MYNIFFSIYLYLINLKDYICIFSYIFRKIKMNNKIHISYNNIIFYRNISFTFIYLVYVGKICYQYSTIVALDIYNSSVYSLSINI